MRRISCVSGALFRTPERMTRFAFQTKNKQADFLVLLVRS
jgi:hypothetical protein